MVMKGKRCFPHRKRQGVLRAKVSFEEIGNRNAIIVTEIPYQVNKAEMIARTAELVKDEKNSWNLRNQR